MTAATAEAPTRIGWVPVPEHAVQPREQISRRGTGSPRTAARGLRARRRGRRDHPVLPDRARRRPAVDRSGAGRRHGRAERRPRRVRRRRGRALARRARPAARRRGPARRRHLRDRARRTARPRDRTRVLLAPSRRPSSTSLTRARARGARADRDRLRHAHPRRRADRRRGGDTPRVGADRDGAWRQARPAGARSGSTDGRQGADRRPQRRPPGHARRCAS